MKIIRIVFILHMANKFACTVFAVSACKVVGTVSILKIKNPF